MLDFLNQIWNYLSSIFYYLVTEIKSLLSLFTAIPEFLYVSLAVIGRVPVIFRYFFSITLVISVLMLLLGRDTK